MPAGLSPISNSMRMSLPWAAWAALSAPAKPELATYPHWSVPPPERGDPSPGADDDGVPDLGEGFTMTGVVEPPAGSLRTARCMSRTISACFRARP